jgi:hypothetical protein
MCLSSFFVAVLHLTTAVAVLTVVYEVCDKLSVTALRVYFVICVSLNYV